MGTLKMMKQRETAPDLEYLMRRYGDQVLRLAYSYLKDVEEAKDAAQEVFLKVYLSLPKFRNQELPYTWIYRVTVNLCRDRLRKKKHFLWQFFEDDSGLISSLNTEDQALAKLEEKEIFMAVMSLPEKYREVIFLYYFYQFNINQISAITGAGITLVKTRLHRARKKLKKLLTANGVLDNA